MSDLLDLGLDVVDLVLDDRKYYSQSSSLYRFYSRHKEMI